MAARGAAAIEGHRVRERGFGILWASSTAANLADGVLIAGLPVLASTVTTSPAAIAGVQVALVVPMVLAALPSGVLVDRGDRGRVMTVTNLVRAAALLAVAAVGGTTGWVLGGVYAAAAIFGASETLADTAAQTAVPGLVPQDRIARAHSRLITTQLVCNDGVGAPLGAALAGSSLAGAGLVGFLLLPTALYTVAAGLVARLRAPDRAAATGPAPARPAPTGAALTTVRQEVREGATFVWRHAALRRLGVANALVNLGNTAFFAVAILLFIGPVGLHRAAFGILLTVLTLGGVLGGVLAERILRTLGERAVLVVGGIATGVAYGLICLTVDPIVGAACMFGLGFVGMVWNVNNRVLRQRLTPDALLGRVTASMRLLALGATPVGAVLGGVVAEVAGVRWVGAVPVLASLGAAAILARPVHAVVHLPPHEDR